MDILCLDLEGVLVPEVWQAVAKETQIPELLKTTRDIPNYDDLMSYRLGIIDRHDITLSQIQAEIAKLAPLRAASPPLIPQPRRLRNPLVPKQKCKLRIRLGNCYGEKKLGKGRGLHFSADLFCADHDGALNSPRGGRFLLRARCVGQAMFVY